LQICNYYTDSLWKLIEPLAKDRENESLHEKGKIRGDTRMLIKGQYVLKIVYGLEELKNDCISLLCYFKYITKITY